MGPPFRRVLVANRGEIAVRIIRTCHALGVEAVAVHSDADAGAAHVLAADAAVRLGPPPAAESYLRADAIIEAAMATGADAVHPGYGFLAERPAFAAAVEEAGLTFIGPSAQVIALLGDKLAARRLAAEAGVPHVAGTLAPADAATPAARERLLRIARGIGYPLLVKAAAGGGGRGMRRVTAEADLGPALSAGAAESLAAFGDGTVYLEREIRPARHVEVQLLGDRHGTVVALGERDCSTQRRHQKLIEEAPAPGLDEAARRHLHELAVRLAIRAGLANAATAEFLLDRDGSFWFLEVNARLQVEHPVTEAMTGLDLVAEQLRIAAGEPLSAAVIAAARTAARPTRHAIEVRLSAEDPAAGFRPETGRVTRWAMPAGDVGFADPDFFRDGTHQAARATTTTVRVETAMRAGDVVPPDYDPLLAKVIAAAPDRPAAIAALRAALAAVDIGGIQTTLPFHLHLLAAPSFVAATGLSTSWVDEQWNGARARTDAARHALQAALASFDTERALPPAPADRRVEPASPWLGAGRAAAIDRWPR